MKEIGGYIEIEQAFGKEYHSSAISLNCGRNCLSYLIEANNIQKIYLPAFLCASVSNVCKKSDVEIDYYNINEQFEPIVPKTFKNGDWFYVVNYYGQFTDAKIFRLKSDISNIIIDNAQDFFRMPIADTPTIYTCRKFFGVSDGAYLYTNKKIIRELEYDYSYDRMHFLMGRFEKNANEFYSEYNANNHFFINEPVKYMSKLTHNFLRSIDYDFVMTKRFENFNYLYDKFKDINKLPLIKTNGSFAYPLLLKNGAEIRKILQQLKIYVPTLWPDVFNLCDEKSLEYNYAKNILPIPIDQRYTIEDMKYIVEKIEEVKKI